MLRVRWATWISWKFKSLDVEVSFLEEAQLIWGRETVLVPRCHHTGWLDFASPASGWNWLSALGSLFVEDFAQIILDTLQLYHRGRILFSLMRSTFKPLICTVRRLEIQVKNWSTLLHVKDWVKDVHIRDLKQLLDEQVHVDLVLLDALSRVDRSLGLGWRDVRWDLSALTPWLFALNLLICRNQDIERLLALLCLSNCLG